MKKRIKKVKKFVEQIHKENKRDLKEGFIKPYGLQPNKPRREFLHKMLIGAEFVAVIFFMVCSVYTILAGALALAIGNGFMGTGLLTTGLFATVMSFIVLVVNLKKE